jgi:hypothetical protein
MDRLIEGWMVGFGMDGLKNGWICGWMDGWINRWY